MSNRQRKRAELYTPQTSELALWGGLECTVNRVGDTYQDQVYRSGHHDRIDDLDLIADLGISALRYPVLWERAAPDNPDELNWTWTDERLNRLRQLGIRPIAGLVHHGCGPRYATYDQPAFEHELARYARRVAERYPWVDAYTPINEPLTTARFGGLYGHWYPHGKSPRTFVDILLRECRATVRAMAEIRAVRPDAQLIQTDDLGKTHSTPLLQYQADLENERRWLSWDLLCGRINPDHPMWDYLRRFGASERDLWFLVENACPPSVMGINHYVTSERYLDHNVRNYPTRMRGGNGFHRYADTEMVRAVPELRTGIGGLLQEAWLRYGLPIVVTEAHLGDTEDEQMRWLGEIWQQAHQAKAAGVDIQAVTVWALLGLYDWHCLLTKREDKHEPGVFNVSSGHPEPTALAPMIKRLAAGEPVESLIPPGLGWWQSAEQKPSLITSWYQ
ncbi:family 1 glycosylhydrolase [Spirosoma soli]|uniref:Family 1 glycosylhydrolase n=1 Tax=Spirosoma soli TaxID=1770529 RepID=A0ABW5M5E4_9BACT